MDWTLNDSQRAVLEWLCTSPSDPAPSGAWKQTARALQGRGLVDVSRKGGQYKVTVTDVGRHMHRYGEYPSDSPGYRQTRGKKRVTTLSRLPEPAVKPVHGTRPQPTKVTAPRMSAELAARYIRDPHPAVRSLMDHPVALPGDAEARRRGFLAAHLLVKAAEEAEMSITASVQPRKRTGGSPYTGEPLVALDAGSSKVVVRIGEYQQRIDHVKTAKEIEDEQRYRYSWAPKYDYVPTGLLCFRLYSRATANSRMNETTNKPLPDFVPRVIRAVQMATQRQIEHEAAHKEWARQQEEREAAARALAERQRHYEVWKKVLLESCEAWEHSQKLREFLHALEAKGETADRTFIAWATSYVEHLDPVQNFIPPEGGVPNLSHDQAASLRQPPSFGSLRQNTL